MVKKIMATSVVVGSMFAFVGCGSDNDTLAVETVTGQFVDTYVSGLNYACSSGTTGITNSAGEYTCNVGDTVEFSLGGYVLGSTTAAEGIVTPESLYPADPVAALNVAQLIQTLDADPTDDIITIPENFTALDDVDTTPEDVDFDDLIETVLVEAGVAEALVTEDVAQDHLDETVSELLLAGKTFYMAGQDVNDPTDTWGGKVTFSADLTELTVVEENGVTETESISIEGDRLVFADNTDGSYTVIGDDKGDYIEVTDYYSDGTIESHTRLYYEESKADSYLASLNGYIAITEAMLSGKTFYDTFTGYADEVCYASMTIGSTSLTRHEICEDASGVETENGSVTFPVALIGGKIRVDTEEEYKWFTLVSEDTTAWHMINDDDEGKDGTLDKLGEENTWYLSKPADFPASL